jgi:hypothetical protein
MARQTDLPRMQNQPPARRVRGCAADRAGRIEEPKKAAARR